MPSTSLRTPQMFSAHEPTDDLTSHCRKREFDSRFVGLLRSASPEPLANARHHLQKKRGKRRSPDAPSSSSTTENPAKKPKVEEPTLSAYLALLCARVLRTELLVAPYQKELQNYADRSLKDSGIGVRPLVK